MSKLEAPMDSSTDHSVAVAAKVSSPLSSQERSSTTVRSRKGHDSQGSDIELHSKATKLKIAVAKPEAAKAKPLEAVILMRNHEDERFALGPNQPWQPQHVIVDQRLLEKESQAFSHLIHLLDKGKLRENDKELLVYHPRLTKMPRKWIEDPLIYILNLAKSKFEAESSSSRYKCLEMSDFELFRAVTIWVHWIESKEFTAMVTFEIKRQLYDLAAFLRLRNDGFIKAVDLASSRSHKMRAKTTYPEAKDDPQKYMDAVERVLNKSKIPKLGQGKFASTETRKHIDAVWSVRNPPEILLVGATFPSCFIYMDN